MSGSGRIPPPRSRDDQELDPQVRHGRSPSRRARAGLVAGIVVAGALASACQARTSIPGLNVRSQPNTASEVVEDIDTSGTRVVLECVTTGEAIHGDTVWYRITSPADGYVTNYYVRTNSTVLRDTPRC